MLKAFLIILNLLAPLAASAAGLDLEKVLESVRQNDPDLAAARADARMGRQMALAAYAWMPPRLDYEWMGLAWPSPDLGASMGHRLALTQELPFPGRTWMKGRAASRLADAREAEAAMAVQQKMREAREAFFELAASERLLSALDQVSEATREMAQASARRAGFGQLDRMGQFMDTMLAMEDSDVESMKPMAQQRRAMAEAKLNRLMGADPMSSLSPAVLDLEALLKEPQPRLEQALSLAEQNNPELRLAQARLAAAGAARGVALSGWLPDLMVSGSVNEDAMGQRSSSAMLGLSLPFVWAWGQAGEASAAGSAEEMARQQLASVRLKLREDLRNAIGELKATLEALRTTTTRTWPKAREGLRLARSGFRTTALGSSEVLMAVQDYRMTEEKISQLIAQAGKARAMLDMLVGGKP